MIVQNKGYLKLEDVLKLDNFSIFETSKGTHILIIDVTYAVTSIYYPQRDRFPYVIKEGKKITNCNRVFNSKTDDLSKIDTSLWNNGNQILTYVQHVNHNINNVDLGY